MDKRDRFVALKFLYPKHAQYLQDSLVCGRPN